MGEKIKFSNLRVESTFMKVLVKYGDMALLYIRTLSFQFPCWGCWLVTQRISLILTQENGQHDCPHSLKVFADNKKEKTVSNFFSLFRAVAGASCYLAELPLDEICPGSSQQRSFRRLNFCFLLLDSYLYTLVVLLLLLRFLLCNKVQNSVWMARKC